MAHAADVFARLVRVLLGKSAVADAKTESGSKLCVLGVDISISTRGFKCSPAAAKVIRWCRDIEVALSRGVLLPGDASKLAGRLSWACCQMFKRFGRAILRPIHEQSTKRDGQIDGNLKRALVWWRTVLQMELAELHSWGKDDRSVIHMFCDASSKPPYLGCVVFVDHNVYWTHSAPPAEVLNSFRSRRDGQIMGLELLAVSLGLSTFGYMLEGRRIVVHCDNSGAEVCSPCVRDWFRFISCYHNVDRNQQRPC